MKTSLKNHYLWVIFLLGMFFLNYPVMAIYNIPKMWMGVPVYYVMVFGFWMMQIVLTFLVVKKFNSKHDA